MNVCMQRTDCQISIPQLIQQSISSCATEMRRDMFSNIIVVGGGSLYEGFVERIQKEAVQFAPAVSIIIKIALILVVYECVYVCVCVLY